MLYRSSFVMYDRQTESRWIHATGRCVSGPLAGKVLETIPSRVMPWKTWRALHPTTRVLDGLPHRGRPGTFRLATDEGEFAYALEIDGISRLYPVSELKKRGVINDVVAKRPVLIMYSQSPRVAQAFERGDRRFEIVGGQLQDEEGHVYDPLEPRHPRTGKRLKPVVLTPWLTKPWFGLHPDGQVFGLGE